MELLSARMTKSPRLIDVFEDNPHGTNWARKEYGYTHLQSWEFAHGQTMWMRFESTEGYWADYFYVRAEARWELGAN